MTKHQANCPKEILKHKINKSLLIARISIGIVSIGAIVASFCLPKTPIIAESVFGADTHSGWFGITKDILANLISINSVYSLSSLVINFFHTKSTRGLKWETNIMTSVSNVAFLGFALLDSSYALLVGTSARTLLGGALIIQKYNYEKNGFEAVKNEKTIVKNNVKLKALIFTTLCLVSSIPIILRTLDKMPDLSLADNIDGNTLSAMKNIAATIACSTAAYNMIPNIIDSHHKKEIKDVSHDMLISQSVASIAAPVFSIFTNSWTLFGLNCLRAVTDTFAAIQKCVLGGKEISLSSSVCECKEPAIEMC